MELTGTNRSNPLDPNAVPSASRGKPGPPSACSGKRQRTRPDAPNKTLPLAHSPIPPSGPPETHRSFRKDRGPPDQPTDQVGGLKVRGGSLRPRPARQRRTGVSGRFVGPRIRSGGSLRPRPARQRRTGVSGRFGQPGGHSEGQNTRSHPELGRENPQRRWYCRSSGGRAGRRQARQTPPTPTPTLPKPGVPGQTAPRPPDPVRERSGGPHAKPTTAGWSSPVARQAHNLKVTGSNPVPATSIYKGLGTCLTPFPLA